MEQLILFVLLVLLGYFFGKMAERKHLESLREREKEFRGLPTIMLRRPLNPNDISNYRLVNGSVVISIDYFKKFLASLINLFGGNMTSYESLVDRARREAILRMKEDAADASEVINIRIETSSISKSAQQSVGAVEVLAYGTAIYR
ncbi:MAG: YbjQ family protein [Sulfurovum sp.]|nr:YbjQ family protein [Sulfurovum sp.]